jgi:hypothetical protein
MAPVRPVLHRLSCNDETVKNISKHEFWIQWSGLGAFVAKSSNVTMFSELVRVRPVLHRVSFSNEMVRNIPNHEFWVKWSGSGALVVKNSNATVFSELMHLCRQFGQFCIVFHAVTKRSDSCPNMSFGSNGVDRVRSLRKDPKQLREVMK